MSHKLTKLLSISLLVSIFILGGCGGDRTIHEEEQVEDQKEVKNSLQPHSITRVLEGDVLPENYAEFAQKIEMSTKIKNGWLGVHINGDDVKTRDIYHMQVYIDIDNDGSTGLNLGKGVYAIVGADYMVEDDEILKSVSNSAWSWEHVKTIKNSVQFYENFDNYNQDFYIDTDLLDGLKVEDGVKIRLSMEPIDEKWKDTNNYVSAKTIDIAYIDTSEREKVTKETLREMIKNGEDYSQVDISEITDMSRIFWGIDSLAYDISDWDVSNVTNMSGMFLGAVSFNQDISDWDVSSVTDMNSMFSGTKSFNQPLISWDVSSVVDMRYMFEFTVFDQDISSWDVSKVAQSQFIFDNCPIQNNYKPNF